MQVYKKVCGLSFAMLLLIGICFMVPLLIIFTNSLMSEQEIARHYHTALSVFDIADGIERRFITFRLIPRSITFSQYQAVLINQPLFLMLMLNSIRITVPVVIGNTFISLLASYGFTIWKWRYKEVLFFIYIVVMLMPLQGVLVPNFIVADWLGISQSHWAIIWPGVFAPFGTFLLRQGMKSIPDECFEAARIDGAGELRLFMFIIAPQMKAGIAALTMLVFVDYWNVVEQAVIFIRDSNMEPLSVFLSRMASGRIGLIFSASVVYMIFPVLGLLYGQDYLEKGIELSGIK